MNRLVIGLRESFWFLPAVIVLSCAVLALGLVEVDGRLPEASFSDFPRLFGAGAEGSRALLSAIATSTITVAGVVFSINIVALSLATAQYSPHVLQNFTRDRANQLVLGIFLGIYTYCLIVLRTVRGSEDAFVPGLSIVVAIVLALVGVAFLIFFIHHISISIQLAHITAQIGAKTGEVIDQLYPKDRSSLGRAESEGLDDAAPSFDIVNGGGVGYVQQIDTEALADVADRSRASIRAVVAVGEFVGPNALLAVWYGAAPPKDKRTQRVVEGSFAIGLQRNIDQDVSFGLEQLVDIACRALTPSNNDTSMALHVQEHVTVLLCALASRDLDGKRSTRRGNRIVVESAALRFEDYLEMTIGPIRRSARGNFRVLLRLIEVLERVGAATTDPGKLTRIIGQAKILDEEMEAGAGLTGREKKSMAVGIRTLMRELEGRLLQGDDGRGGSAARQCT